ncbi:MAG: hypothetical protein JG776_985 [Caloramator sp.]|uniref:hypothetical protein n=1 Tax=Caloramator sp. TaxID=1871330 RepID=UPI001D4ECC8B|nr:hypothetical protein [Caloramator sp.]MBZ4663283.1 hypothetical protein [Caloramator sp.]
MKVPIVDSVSSRNPILAFEEFEDYFPLPNVRKFLFLFMVYKIYDIQIGTNKNDDECFTI